LFTNISNIKELDKDKKVTKVTGLVHI